MLTFSPLARIRKMSKVAPGNTALSGDAGTSISFRARSIDVKDIQKYIILA